MGKKQTKPLIYIKSGKTSSVIVGYTKKELPSIAKKVVKGQLSKKNR
jgi:hypothetical protein